MQVVFTQWCMDPAGRTKISVNPLRVTATVRFGDAFTQPGTAEYFPAATKIILEKDHRAYIVQGTVDEVVNQLNTMERGGK